MTEQNKAEEVKEKPKEIQFPRKWLFVGAISICSFFSYLLKDANNQVKECNRAMNKLTMKMLEINTLNKEIETLKNIKNDSIN